MCRYKLTKIILVDETGVKGRLVTWYKFKLAFAVKASRHRTGEEKRRQTLCNKRDTNFV